MRPLRWKCSLGTWRKRVRTSRDQRELKTIDQKKTIPYESRPFRFAQNIRWFGLACCLVAAVRACAATLELRDQVKARVEAEYPSLEAIYKELHAHPELSFMEVKTAAFLAGQLRTLGFDVTEKVGNTGIVAVLKNGPGATVLLRGDMDGLPVKEVSGMPYASTDVVKDMAGRDQPAMHACAHDTHVTNLIGTARVLVALKDRWSGTLVIVGQPAEEIGAGAPRC